MVHLSAFADEISTDLDEQLAVLTGEGIRYLDLRGAWHTNVLDFSDEQVRYVERALDRNGVRVASIGSPLGKSPIDRPFEDTLEALDRMLALAGRLDTRFIRIFSFYPPGAGSMEPLDYRDAVVDRLRVMASRAATADVVLLHENERGIYGDTIARCVEILQVIDSPHLRAVFDPANFVQCGQTPFPDAYETLERWIAQVHVKDALRDGSVTVAGGGTSRWLDLLRRLRAGRYDGFLSLEPHLAEAGQFAGFSGPELFRRACSALKNLLHEVDWPFDDLPPPGGLIVSGDSSRMEGEHP